MSEHRSELQNDLFTSHAEDCFRSSPLTAAGETVGTSEVWSDTFESEHVADLYSSRIEATKSIARRCAVRLRRYSTEHSPQTEVVVHFQMGQRWPDAHRDDVAMAFKEEFRRTAPAIKLSANELPDSPLTWQQNDYNPMLNTTWGTMQATSGIAHPSFLNWPVSPRFR